MKLQSNWIWKSAGLLIAAVLVISATVIFTYGADGEWIENEHGWWYQYADGTYPSNQWLEIDDSWYWFDQNGYAATGWVNLNANWYYFNENGVMLTGIQVITNQEGVTNTYYLDPNGVMLTGWQFTGEDWYYFDSQDGSMRADNSAKGTDSLVGVDVSKWQADIDWKAVQDFGIDFAFIRVGHDDRILDPYYVKNITAANEIGLPVGVYYYSTASSLAESVLDAQFVIDQLQGHTVSYPVVIDLEDSSQSSCMTKAQITAIGKAFCDEIRKAGYTPMVYCNENWCRNYLDMNAMGDVEHWIARYNGIHDTNITREIWQACSTSKVNGIQGNVDLDFAFTDYTQVITPRSAALDTYVKSTGVWEQDATGWWYSYLAGGYPKNEWVEIEGTWYWFNEAGYESPVIGWQYLNNEWYYYDESGKAASGWRVVNDKWYYIFEGGKMASGWQLINEKWYYLGGSDDGVMQSGWQLINNKWYYLGASGDGSMKTGWQWINGKWYYMDETGDGRMLTGWQKINGSWYYMDETGDGRMMTGWQWINGNWYFMYDSGAMAESTWIGNYYVDASGAWRQ